MVTVEWSVMYVLVALQPHPVVMGARRAEAAQSIRPVQDAGSFLQLKISRGCRSDHIDVALF